jgi:hypothetical protein
MGAPTRTISILILSFSLLWQACATNIGKTLGRLAAVRADITKKFGDEVYVHESTFEKSTAVFINFINSPLNDKTDELRAARAQETAQIVKAHYPSTYEIDFISVGFIRERTRFLVINYREGVASFQFDRNAKPILMPGSDSGEPSGLNPTARYSPTQNKTDVSVSLQLDRGPGSGVTLVPHFSVLGDANQQPSTPPKEAMFDVASYSATRKFPQDTKLIILVDGEKIVEKDVSFSSSKAADGQTAEFLYVTFPYEAFPKIGKGNEVTIEIAPYKYTL